MLCSQGSSLIQVKGISNFDGGFQASALKDRSTCMLGSCSSIVEVERAWARARRPGPDIGLAVNKPQGRGSTSLIFQ